jgi:hypothetical protein
VPFGRKFSTNNQVDVKKIVTIVFLAAIFCLVLGTTSLAEVANIESSYVVFSVKKNKRHFFKTGREKGKI